MDTFKTIVLGEKEYTALKFGPDGYEIPTRLMQMTREKGILVTDDDIYEFPWRGITKDIEGQYILFDHCSLESFDSILTIHRDIALDLLRKLALGIKMAGKGFFSLSNGILPLYQILIHEGKDIVILPSDCAEIIATSRIRSMADREVTWFMKPDTEKGFSLIMEMAELMYYAAAGVLPYGEEAIRRSGFKEVPLQMYEEALNKDAMNFISSTLNKSEREQRKLSGNRKPEENMDYFLSATEKMEWNLPSRTEEERVKAVEAMKENKEFNSLYEAAVRKAKFRDFWRKHGLTILIVVLSVGFSSYLIGNFFFQKYKPPVTRSMSPEEIIVHLFDCQTRLDMAELSEGFKGDPAQFNEVLNLYVGSTTRNAYEGIKAYSRADEWIAEGMGAIPEETNIYGAIVDSIEDLGDNNYLAHTTWYAPFVYNEEDEVTTPIPQGKKLVFLYSVDEEFTFQWNKRGWWEGVRTAITDYKLKEIMEVETYRKESRPF